MKTLNLLKDDINNKIKNACCHDHDSCIVSYIIESEKDDNVLQELYEYLKENQYRVQFTDMTKNLRKFRISWKV